MYSVYNCCFFFIYAPEQYNKNATIGKEIKFSLITVNVDRTLTTKQKIYIFSEVRDFQLSFTIFLFAAYIIENAINVFAMHNLKYFCARRKDK